LRRECANGPDGATAEITRRYRPAHESTERPRTSPPVRLAATAPRARWGERPPVDGGSHGCAAHRPDAGSDEDIAGVVHAGVYPGVRDRGGEDPQRQGGRR